MEPINGPMDQSPMDRSPMDRWTNQWTALHAGAFTAEELTTIVVSYEKAYDECWVDLFPRSPSSSGAGAADGAASSSPGGAGWTTSESDAPASDVSADGGGGAAAAADNEREKKSSFGPKVSDADLRQSRSSTCHPLIRSSYINA